MARLNGLWWWIDRWRKSTAYTEMTLEEQGAFRNLLDEAHLRGGAIPNDERILSRACGDALMWERVKPAVMRRFELKPDGWRNETLDKVLLQSIRRADKQQAYRERKAGKVAGNVQGNAPRNTVAPVLAPVPKTAYNGRRFKVWTWQHEEFVRALGSKPFDLLAWYPKLDAAMEKSGAPIVDEARWLREEFYEAAGLERPNLFGKRRAVVDRKGPPDAAATRAILEGRA